MHALHPYSSTDLTLQLNIRILVFIRIFSFFRNWHNFTKIPIAFLIRALTYWSFFPPGDMTPLGHVNCTHSFINHITYVYICSNHRIRPQLLCFLGVNFLPRFCLQVTHFLGPCLLSDTSEYSPHPTQFLRPIFTLFIY